MKQGYKQTEVGVLPDDWTLLQLEEAALVVDSLHQTPSFSADGYAMVRVADIKTGNLNLKGTQRVSQNIFAVFTKGYRPKRGDIVLSRVGSYGVSSFVDTDEPFCMGQNTVVLQPRIPARYLYYALNSRAIRQQVEDGSYGSGYKALSLKNIKDLTIPAPATKAEQGAIAAALGDVDALIGALDQLIAKKRDLKRAAMQQLLTGRRRLSGFRGEWAEVKLGEISDVAKGAGLSKSAISSSGARCCILYGELFTTYHQVIDSVVSRTNSAEGRLSQCGDILVPGSTTTEGIDLATASALLVDGVALGGDINIIRSKSSRRYDPAFLANYLTHVKKSDIAELAQGTTIIHLYGRDLRSLTLQLPSVDEQSAVAKVLSDLDAELIALEQRRNKTRALKQGMMQELLTGRTRLV